MRKTLVTLGRLVTAATAFVAQIRYLPDAPGAWKAWVFTALARNDRSSGAARLAAVIAGGYGISRVHCSVSVYCRNVTALPSRKW
jgi:hypothetical protein